MTFKKVMLYILYTIYDIVKKFLGGGGIEGTTAYISSNTPMI